MRTIKWTAEVHRSHGVIEVDDDATDEDIWAEVEAEAEQYFSADWEEASANRQGI